MCAMYTHVWSCKCGLKSRNSAGRHVCVNPDVYLLSSVTEIGLSTPSFARPLSDTAALTHPFLFLCSPRRRGGDIMLSPQR